MVLTALAELLGLLSLLVQDRVLVPVGRVSLRFVFSRTGSAGEAAVSNGMVGLLVLLVSVGAGATLLIANTASGGNNDSPITETLRQMRSDTSATKQSLEEQLGTPNAIHVRGAISSAIDEIDRLELTIARLLAPRPATSQGTPAETRELDLVDRASHYTNLSSTLRSLLEIIRTAGLKDGGSNESGDRIGIETALTDSVQQFVVLTKRIREMLETTGGAEYADTTEDLISGGPEVTVYVDPSGTKPRASESEEEDPHTLDSSNGSGQGSSAEETNETNPQSTATVRSVGGDDDPVATAISDTAESLGELASLLSAGLPTSEPAGAPTAPGSGTVATIDGQRHLDRVELAEEVGNLLERVHGLIARSKGARSNEGALAEEVGARLTTVQILIAQLSGSHSEEVRLVQEVETLLPTVQELIAGLREADPLDFEVVRDVEAYLKKVQELTAEWSGGPGVPSVLYAGLTPIDTKQPSSGSSLDSGEYYKASVDGFQISGTQVLVRVINQSSLDGAFGGRGTFEFRIQATGATVTPRDIVTGTLEIGPEESVTVHIASTSEIRDLVSQGYQRLQVSIYLRYSEVKEWPPSQLLDSRMPELLRLLMQ